VWVEARGLALEASRASSAPPGACRCRFLRKLMPRCRPVGRDEGECEVVEMAVAATVGAAGAGAVNIVDYRVAHTSEMPEAHGGCECASFDDV
jgi:hypothetical protein